MFEHLKNHKIAYGIATLFAVVIVVIGFAQPTFIKNLTGSLTGVKIASPIIQGIKKDILVRTEFINTIATCGNGVVESGEECDGNNVGSVTCTSKGFDGGSIACTSDCKITTSNCYHTPVCGNGTKEAGEECDTDNFGGATCKSRGFDSGILACSDDCHIGDGLCINDPVCGNGKRESGEECDGNNVRGITCIRKGFEGGSIACTSDCKITTSNCYHTPVCGNGTKEAGEECDYEGVLPGSYSCEDGAINETVCKKCKLIKFTCPDTEEPGSSTDTDIEQTEYKFTSASSNADISISNIIHTITIRNKKIVCNKETKETLLGIFCLMKGY